jgi:23S rRNA (cytosine1962-C5)-methyltransferase
LEPARVYLKPGREKSVRNRNPWIFSGAVSHIEGCTENGQPAEVFSAGGEFLAAGYVNPESRIPCRILSWERIAVDRALIERRIRDAAALRVGVLDSADSCRLVNSEGDFLPGLVVDRYGEGVVFQVLTAGMERFRADIVDIIGDMLSPAFIVERSDVSSRLDEGLAERLETVRGSVDSPVEIRESGLAFRVDVLRGQKTGFYLDQRDSRRLIGGLAKGRRALDLFSYTGGFGVYAAAGGAAEVTLVDSSGPALDLARANMERNGFGSLPAEYFREDTFRFLNGAKKQWDMIVIDPPAFAAHKAQIEKAARGYKDLIFRALGVLAPGGILAAFSCSHHISRELFRQIVYAAVVDSGRTAQVIAQTSHPADHPVDICHREGEYLKGIVLEAAG